jgi:MFS family permease
MTSVNEVHIEETINQPTRYWYIDGIPETVIGGVWLLVSFGILAAELLRDQREFRDLAAVFIYGTIAIGLLMPFVMPRVIRRWKERVTYPRTGYVEPRRPSMAVKIASISLFGMMAFGVVLAARSGSFLRGWMPIAVGMVASGSLVHVAWRMRAARLAMLAPIIAVAALITTAMRLEIGLSYGVIWFVAGAVCLIDGLLTLRGYLKAHPAPAGEER